MKEENKIIDKKVLQIHFSKNAVNYDTYANVQKKMAHELIKAVTLEGNDVNDGINILDIGCGTGYLTERLIYFYPKAKITAVDIAPGMVEYAREKFKNKDIEFQCIDIEEAEINSKYDLIISNAAFQWFNQLEKTIVKLGSMLKNNGILAFSTFGSMTFNELHQSYKIARDRLNLDMELLPGQSFLSCEDLAGICRRNLADTHSSMYRITSFEKLEYEYFDTVRGFLDSVKKIGANNSNRGRKTISALTREMMNTYETVYKEDNRIKATYHCIFLTAKKQEPVLRKGRMVNGFA